MTAELQEGLKISAFLLAFCLTIHHYLLIGREKLFSWSFILMHTDRWFLASSTNFSVLVISMMTFSLSKCYFKTLQWRQQGPSSVNASPDQQFSLLKAHPWVCCIIVWCAASCPLLSVLWMLPPWIRELPEEHRAQSCWELQGLLVNSWTMPGEVSWSLPMMGLLWAECREKCWSIWQTQWLPHCEASENGHLSPTKHQPLSLLSVTPGW